MLHGETVQVAIGNSGEDQRINEFVPVLDPHIGLLKFGITASVSMLKSSNCVTRKALPKFNVGRVFLGNLTRSNG